MLENINVSHSPHISQPLSTRRIMVDVIIALLPAAGFAAYYFRMYALVLIATCVLSAVATEWICNLIRKKPNSLGDFSAALTGLILALSLPPALPFWAAIIGTITFIYKPSAVGATSVAIDYFNTHPIVTRRGGFAQNPYKDRINAIRRFTFWIKFVCCGAPTTTIISPIPN